MTLKADWALGEQYTHTAANAVATQVNTNTTDIAGKAATSHTHTASQISDSTTVGRNVVTATDAAAARTAIGAGTSSLVIGTGAGDAKAGDYQPTWSQVTSKPSTFAPIIGSGAGDAVAGNDSRLTDARTPTSHTHAVADINASTSTALGVGSIELGHASDTTITRSGTGAIAVEGVAVLLSGGALGTPSSGTLTSCTSLPISGLTASTSTALGVGSIELGHASDTTVARVSAGVISVEGVTVPTISSTNTFTNKRITPRVGSTSSSATPSINTDDYDEYDITALAAAITSMTTNLTGTPTNGQKLMLRFKDNGTARAITWGTSFQSSGVATLLATTVISKTHYVGLIYDSTAAKWVCIAVDAAGY